MAEVQFDNAPEVEKIANDLISKYHKHLIDHAVTVKYRFRSDTPKKLKKTVLGTARKVTGLNMQLAGERKPFFVITITRPTWQFLNENVKVALVDHELSHCQAFMKSRKKSGPVLVTALKAHDVEDFGHIIERHGLWTRDVQEFMKSAAAGGFVQMTLELVTEGTKRTEDFREEQKSKLTGKNKPDAVAASA